MLATTQNNISFSSRRIATGLSLEDLKQELGVSISEVQDWETGAKTPPSHIIHTLDNLQRFQSVRQQKEVDSQLAPEASPDEADVLIKSKKRVADHGEVFTPPWLVEKMLDLVKGETERIDCQRRSKNLPDGGLKVGHCSWRPFAVAGGVKVVQFVVS